MDHRTAQNSRFFALSGRTFAGPWRDYSEESSPSAAYKITSPPVRLSCAGPQPLGVPVRSFVCSLLLRENNFRVLGPKTLDHKMIANYWEKIPVRNTTFPR